MALCCRVYSVSPFGRAHDEARLISMTAFSSKQDTLREFNQYREYDLTNEKSMIVFA